MVLMETQFSPPDLDNRVLVLTPTGADGVVAAGLLSSAGIEPYVCGNLNELCDALLVGAGAILVAQEALVLTDMSALLNILGAQPPWSDISLIVLTTSGESGYATERLTDIFGLAANITFIERPLQVATLITNLRTALRA